MCSVRNEIIYWQIYLSTRHPPPILVQINTYMKSSNSEERPFLRTIILSINTLIIDKFLFGFFN